MFRRGQWVKTTRELNISSELAGQPVSVKIPAGAIGIHHKIDANEVRVDAEGKETPIPGRYYYTETGAPRKFKKNEVGKLVGLHLVDTESGFNTILEAAVEEDVLEPILSLDEIPEPRRKTFSEGWKPRA